MKTQIQCNRHRGLLSWNSAWLALVALAAAPLLADPQPPTPAAPAVRAFSVPAPTTPPATQPASFLAWEADSKDYEARLGDLAAPFTIYVTNVSSEVVMIRELKRSCGCTEAKLPAQPWAMQPGTNGPIVATMDLRGKTGRLSKSLTVESSAGTKILQLNVNIPPAPAAPATAGLPSAEPAIPFAQK